MSISMQKELSAGSFLYIPSHPIFTSTPSFYPENKSFRKLQNKIITNVQYVSEFHQAGRIFDDNSDIELEILMKIEPIDSHKTDNFPFS